VATDAHRLKVANAASLAIIALAAVASAVGLFMPSVYRETAWVVPQNRGQDLVTLAALAVLLPTVLAAMRGSARAQLIWLGLLGYIAYTYTGAAFVYGFNELFLIYVALFSLSIIALIATLSAIDAPALRAQFDASTPRRSVIAFLLVMSIMLCGLWFSQIVPFYIDGTLPQMILLAKTPTVYVYVLDLGVVVPLAVVAAWWLARDRPWGFVLAGFVLIKAATMGLALVSMTVFAERADQNPELAMSVAWIALALTGVAMSAWYFAHCSGRVACTTSEGFLKRSRERRHRPNSGSP
jgi:hypothetical protein